MKNIGALGEALVAQWLQLQNYKLLEQNWRCRWGEIDIIAQERVSKAIAFVEVKTRSSNNWDEGGLLAIDSAKQAKIIATAEMFLAKYPHLAELPCRFDVALVSYENAIADNNTSKLVTIKIGQPVGRDKYQLTIKNYLQSAFE